MKIYVNFEIPNTVKEFIEKLFTHKVGNSINCVRTYEDEKFTKIQCLEGKYRSFDDLLFLVQTYFPKCTPKELMHTLLIHKIPYNKRSYSPILASCLQMRKIRFFYNSDHTRAYYSSFCDQYDSMYSWKELLAMLGLITRADIIDYIIKHEK